MVVRKRRSKWSRRKKKCFDKPEMFYKPSSRDTEKVVMILVQIFSHFPEVWGVLVYRRNEALCQSESFWGFVWSRIVVAVFAPGGGMSCQSTSWPMTWLWLRKVSQTLFSWRADYGNRLYGYLDYIISCVLECSEKVYITTCTWIIHWHDSLRHRGIEMESGKMAAQLIALVIYSRCV